MSAHSFLDFRIGVAGMMQSLRDSNLQQHLGLLVPPLNYLGGVAVEWTGPRTRHVWVCGGSGNVAEK